MYFCTMASFRRLTSSSSAIFRSKYFARSCSFILASLDVLAGFFPAPPEAAAPLPPPGTAAAIAIAPELIRYCLRETGKLEWLIYSLISAGLEFISYRSNKTRRESFLATSKRYVESHRGNKHHGERDCPSLNLMREQSFFVPFTFTNLILRGEK